MSERLGPPKELNNQWLVARISQVACGVAVWPARYPLVWCPRNFHTRIVRLSGRKVVTFLHP